MLATQLNNLIYEKKLEDFTIVKIVKFVVNNINRQATKPNKIIILLRIEPLVPGEKVNSFISI